MFMPFVLDTSAHKYWRLYISKMTLFAESYRAAVIELELRDTVGGSTIATDTARITARSSNGSYPPANAVDASSSTWWLSDTPFSSATDYTWLAYEFPSPVSIKQFGISFPYETYGAAWQPTDFELQWSNDGTTWTTVPSSVITGETFSNNTLKTYTL